MFSARATSARRLVAAFRQARPIPARVARRDVKPVLRRGYASGGSSHGAPSSDIPWLIGSIAVTAPSVWYLWPTPHEGGHGHGEHGDHDEDADSKSHDEETESESKAEDNEDDEDQDEGDGKNAEETPDGDEKATKSKSQSQPDRKEEGTEDGADENAKDDESGRYKSKGEKSSNNKVDGVQFKGKTNAGDENNEQTGTRKRESDGKSAFKKRIDSDYQKDLGAGDLKDEDGKPTGATATKKSGDAGAIDTKQAGLSTTPTRHSTQIDEDPEKSKKPSGAPETAKSQTTIDPEQDKKR